MYCVKVRRQQPLNWKCLWLEVLHPYRPSPPTLAVTLSTGWRFEVQFLSPHARICSLCRYPLTYSLNLSVLWCVINPKCASHSLSQGRHWESSDGNISITSGVEAMPAHKPRSSIHGGEILRTAESPAGKKEAYCASNVSVLTTDTTGRC